MLQTQINNKTYRLELQNDRDGDPCAECAFCVNKQCEMPEVGSEEIDWACVDPINTDMVWKEVV